MVFYRNLYLAVISEDKTSVSLKPLPMNSNTKKIQYSCSRNLKVIPNSSTNKFFHDDSKPVMRNNFIQLGTKHNGNSVSSIKRQIKRDLSTGIESVQPDAGISNIGSKKLKIPKLNIRRIVN